MEELNKRVEEEIDEPLRIGLGLHSGKAIIGAMGYGTTKPVTAIGSTVNTAARLEGESKKFGSELLLSQQVLDAAGVDLSGTEEHDITFRCQEKAIHVHVVKVARDLNPKKRMPMTEEAK